MAGFEVDGLKALLARMTAVNIEMVKRVKVAVETSAIRVANHAKAGHIPGEGHAAGRYENQTTNLTNSIIPQVTKADKDSVEASVSTIMDYGPKVEVSHPYFGPALVSQEKEFKEGVKKAIHGNV